MRSRTSSLPRSTWRARARSSPPRRASATRSRRSAARPARLGAGAAPCGGAAAAVPGSAVSVIATELLRRANLVVLRPMTDDHGAPISYITLREGTPVLASDGAQVGVVAHVLYDGDADIFDGIVIDARGRGHRFVDAPEVDRIAERAVTLKIDSAAVAKLPPPSANPAEMKIDPADSGRRGVFRRAWDRISGR